MTQARQLTETALNLITDCIQSNIGAALVSVQTMRNDNVVTMESPPSDSYFNFYQAHGYRCPAIFVVDAGMDFRQDSVGANFINSLATINVSVKVEDKDKYLLTKKALRYQAALHQILDQTPLDSSDDLVSIKVRVKKITPSGLYTYAEEEPDTTASFFFEYMLELEVDFFENF